MEFEAKAADFTCGDFGRQPFGVLDSLLSHLSLIERAHDD